MNELWSLAKETVIEWRDDRAPRLGAALAYYTVFSIAPLLIISAAIAGIVFGAEATEGRLVRELEGLLGRDSARFIQSVIERFSEPKQGIIATAIGIVTILVGATGLFSQLQDALNTIWNVRRKPGSGLRATVREYFASFTMVLVIGFLLLVSLVISTALSAIGEFLGGRLPLPEPILQGLNFLLSLIVITLLFAMIFKILPDVFVRWNDVWIGAIVTAFLFTVGKSLIGLYLGKSTVTSAYGAAGSLVVVLIWVYYSSQILLLGAEFTQVYTRRKGRPVVPRRGAVWVTRVERIVQGMTGTKGKND